jgi:hypothetical protein
MIFHRIARSGGGWSARLGGLILASAALLLILPATASAHAVPVSSTPNWNVPVIVCPSTTLTVFQST